MLESVCSPFTRSAGDAHRRELEFYAVTFCQVTLLLSSLALIHTAWFLVRDVITGRAKHFILAFTLILVRSDREPRGSYQGLLVVVCPHCRRPIGARILI